MIDPKLFTVEGLLGALLDDQHGNRNRWWRNVEIVPDYMPPFPQPDTRRKCVVRYPLSEDRGRYKYSFLRHSAGPRQGHFWDLYGDDYLTPDLALIALLEAPVPPCLLVRDVWEPPLP